jgi:hypothetical protein
LATKNGNGNNQANLAKAMTEVSERVTVLIKEEIELAKAEVTTKISKLSKGIVFGGIGLVLGLLLVPFVLLTAAWGLNSLLSSLWLGFLIVTGVMLVAMGACFFLAWRKIKAAGNPAPTMAIDEAKKIRQTVTAKSSNGGSPERAPAPTVSTISSTVPAAPAPTPASPEAPAPTVTTAPTPAPPVAGVVTPAVADEGSEAEEPKTEKTEGEKTDPGAGS